jgi:hypothetical protein
MAANRQPFQLIMIHTADREEKSKRIYDKDWFVQPSMVIGIFGLPGLAWSRRDGMNYHVVDATIVMDHLILTPLPRHWAFQTRSNPLPLCPWATRRRNTNPRNASHCQTWYAKRVDSAQLCPLPPRHGRHSDLSLSVDSGFSKRAVSGPRRSLMVTTEKNDRVSQLAPNAQ